jgi:hypothetical protein
MRQGRHQLGRYHDRKLRNGKWVLDAYSRDVSGLTGCAANNGPTLSFVAAAPRLKPVNPRTPVALGESTIIRRKVQCISKY